jgi:hypothetical protein
MQIINVFSGKKQKHTILVIKRAKSVLTPEVMETIGLEPNDPLSSDFLEDSFKEDFNDFTKKLKNAGRKININEVFEALVMKGWEITVLSLLPKKKVSY